MAATPTTATAARALGQHAAYTAGQQAVALRALLDQANGGRGVSQAEAALLVDLVADLRRAASAAGWLDGREAGEAA